MYKKKKYTNTCQLYILQELPMSLKLNTLFNKNQYVIIYSKYIYILNKKRLSYLFNYKTKITNIFKSVLHVMLIQLYGFNFVEMY